LGLCSIFFISEGFSTLIETGDFSLFFFLAYSVLGTLFFFYIVFGTQSKYATIAGGRLLIVTISLDVFFMIV
jgi:NADH:ubiquinone oxidoreductase subunit H